MKVFGIFLMTLMASCAGEPKLESVCNIARSPDKFVGIPLTVSGGAKMSRHLSTLTDPKCPDLGIPITTTSSNPEFHRALGSTLAPWASPIQVTVVGKVVRNPGLPAYHFEIATARIRASAP